MQGAIARFSGEALRRLREQTNLSQSKLARRAGLREQQINRWENQHNVPSADNVAVLARALGCEITDLFESGDRDSDDEEDSEMHRVAQLLEGLGQIDLADALYERARRKARAAERGVRA